MKNVEPSTKGGRHLSEIRGLESIGARMPTPEECQTGEFRVGVPVLVLRFREGMIERERLYSADAETLIVDPEPELDPNKLYDAAREILRYVIEEISNSLDDLVLLNRAGDSPRKMLRLAADMRTRRKETYYCSEPWAENCARIQFPGHGPDLAALAAADAARRAGVAGYACPEGTYDLAGPTGSTAERAIGSTATGSTAARATRPATAGPTATGSTA